MNRVLNILTAFSALLLCVLAGFVFFKGSESNERAILVKTWMKEGSAIRVLTSVAMLSDLAEQIGGDKVFVVSLIHGELDPHTYELVKGDGELFDRADVVFSCGLGLEHTPNLLERLADHKRHFCLGDALTEVPGLVLYNDRVADPHAWMDISLWKRHVRPMTEALCRVDAVNKEFYEANAKLLEESLDAAHDWVRSTLQMIPKEKRYLVTSHDAFTYFARAYLREEGEDEASWRLRCAAPEGLAPQAQLSTEDAAAIVKHIIDYKVSVIFPESNVSKESIAKVLNGVQKSGHECRVSNASLFADAMGESGTPEATYIGMVKHNAESIARELR